MHRKNIMFYETIITTKTLLKPISYMLINHDICEVVLMVLNRSCFSFGLFHLSKCESNARSLLHAPTPNNQIKLPFGELLVSACNSVLLVYYQMGSYISAEQHLHTQHAHVHVKKKKMRTTIIKKELISTSLHNLISIMNQVRVKQDTKYLTMILTERNALVTS